MRLVTFLLFSSLVFGQTATPPSDPTSQPSASSSDQKTQSQDLGLGVGAHGKQLGALDILSDTQGVDFGPYLTEVLKGIRENWYHLIPESAETKKGKLAIEFAITKDGKVADMRLVARAEDETLNRAAWGSITASNPFKHLPSDFTGPYLALRIRFYYNPDKNDLPDSKIPRVGHLKSTPPVPQLKVRPGIKVSIYPPTNLEVPQGGSKTLTPLVTGTGNRDDGVEWSVSGFGCSGVACGQMTNDTYQAPTAMPNPPFVTLTASSKADPSAKASVTVHIVASGSPADKSLFHSETHTTYIDTNFGTVVMEYADESGATESLSAPLSTPIALESDLPDGLPHARMVVTCTLNASGNLTNPRVLEPGPAQMTAKVLAALRRWKFRPAMRNNRAVEVTAILGFGIDTTSR